MKNNKLRKFIKDYITGKRFANKGSHTPETEKEMKLFRLIDEIKNKNT